MKPLPEYLRATAFEYRHRFLLHGLVYALGFAAPWHLPAWSFLQNQSTWFLIADGVSKPTFANFAPVWNAVCAGMLLFAVAGAFLRTWGAAYLGAQIVHQGDMNGSQVIANGPYRFVRNPLYLGTLLHTVTLGMLMRPEAGLLTFFLLLIVQLRLIGSEEVFLLRRQGAAYAAYCERVPRLIPRLRPAVMGSGARADWRQGFLSEIYPVGVALALLVLGWTRGFGWETSLWHVTQGVVIALGISVAVRGLVHRPSEATG